MMGNPNQSLQFDSLHFDPDWSFEAPESAEITKARFILNRLFQDFPGAFAIRLWNGSMLYIGEGAPAFTFCLQQASVLRDMVLFSDPKRLAEAYFAGNIQILGDFNAAMQLRHHFDSLSLPLHEKLGLVFRALTLADNQPAAATPQSTETETQVAEISLDHAAPAGFYQLWLDERMLHSCAYFCNANEDLDRAQQNQLDLICHKLHLQHGDKVLDIGGGWGGWACWAARHYGVFVHSITQNPEQFAYMTEQVQQQGLQDKVQVSLCHYSDLPEAARYDKVVSIGICEHVGRKDLPAYLAKVHAVLKPGGLFLDHSVTTESPSPQHEICSDFIHRNVFPDAEWATLPQIQAYMREAKFDLCSTEGLRRHQALTLRRWVENLEQHHQEVADRFGERTYRMWRLYLTACAIQFEQGVTGLQQMLAVRR